MRSVNTYEECQKAKKEKNNIQLYISVFKAFQSQ